MTVVVTLSLYIARQFSLAVTAALFALTGFVALFDFIDLLRRATGHPGVGLALVVASRCSGCPISRSRCCRSRCNWAGCTPSGGSPGLPS